MAQWVSTWGQAHTELRHFSPGFQDNTMLMSVPSQLDGEKIRIRFSNREGKMSYSILESSIQIGERKPVPLTFSGSGKNEFPPEAEQYVDTVDLPIHAGEQITLRVAFGGKVMSGNGIAAMVHASKKGNFVNVPQFDPLKRGKTDAYRETLRPIAAVSSIEVFSAENAKALICFGDSITQQSQWTVPLTLRMAGTPWSVINKGIGGNRLLSDPMFKAMGMYGRKALNRFDRDVLGEAGAQAVILELGTNDLGSCRDPHGKGGATAEMLMAGFEELAGKAKAHGLAVFCATITPRCGCFGWKPAHEAERQKLNRMIRESHAFDAVIDFDRAISDSKQPEVMDMRYDSGDHLHPGVLGGQRIAEEVYRVLEGNLG